MRILLIGHYSPPRGGVQTHIVTLHEYLKAHEVSCEVIDMGPQRKTNGMGIYGPRTALDVVRLLLKLRYDVVHLHVGGNLTDRLTLLALLCATIPPRKAMLTFHSGGYPSSPAGRAARPRSLRGLALRKLSYVIAVNEEIRNWFGQVGVDPGRIRLIPPHALPASPPAVKLPERLQSFFAAHEPVLVSVGGLEPQYDVPLQIEALHAIREKFPRAGLVIVGAGSLQKELEQRIAGEPLGKHVLLSGDLAREVTLRVIADSDVMLRTTLYDGDAISVREAVQFGVPVVASDRAPRPEGVRVVPAQNLSHLKEEIEQCLLEGARGPVVGEASEENLDAIMALYEKVVNESAPPKTKRAES
ncbi:MAG TPA: glycosyltransferase family 4 protein [Pyrinomonadaceae bacterium]|nr:glycosyltransferase family 4 protein [Pyrinomonadaceae bacterium]